MVMLANNKTIEQIDQDLRLFLGDNSEKFTAWLRNAVANPESLKKERGEVVYEEWMQWLITIILKKANRLVKYPRPLLPHHSEHFQGIGG